MPTDGSLTRWRSRRGLRIAALLAGVSLSAVAAHAQDATWNLNGTGEFNTPSNWTPATVPTGTAFFGVSNQNNVTFSATTSNINSWTFNAGASNYNFIINAPLLTGGINFFGAGIVLNGGTANIINSSTLGFSSGTAGSATIINNAGVVVFSGSSTAGSATIINNFVPALAQFPVQFIGSSTAGNATIINNNPLTFQQNSTAGNATINNNSQIIFFDAGTGGAARLMNGSAGTVDMSFLSTAGMTVGSIEGAGTIALSSKNLAVGGNNLTTTFNGILQDGGLGGGTGGSLTKTGTGTLTLTGNNTYTGATVVNSGGLIVNGFNGSSSLTTVNNGAVLSGTGTVGNTQINSGGHIRARLGCARHVHHG
jgi:autotransporter-associated beta strand protein